MREIEEIRDALYAEVQTFTDDEIFSGVVICVEYPDQEWYGLQTMWGCTREDANNAIEAGTLKEFAEVDETWPVMQVWPSAMHSSTWAIRNILHIHREVMNEAEIRVEIVSRDTGKAVKVIACRNESQAERVERGASMRADPERFFVRIAKGGSDDR